MIFPKRLKHISLTQLYTCIIVYIQIVIPNESLQSIKWVSNHPSEHVVDSDMASRNYTVDKRRNNLKKVHLCNLSNYL